MRSLAFNVAYWLLSIVYASAAAFAALTPGRGATSWIIRRYVKRMVQAMRLLAGIHIQVRDSSDFGVHGCFIITHILLHFQ